MTSAASGSSTSTKNGLTVLGTTLTSSATDDTTAEDCDDGNIRDMHEPPVRSQFEFGAVEMGRIGIVNKALASHSRGQGSNPAETCG